MATYENDLRLKEITTGDEAGTWGTSTNTNLGLVAEAFSYGVENLGSDANATLTVADGVTDEARSFYLKLTSTTLSATRTVTIAPQSLSKVWIIENATTGGQSLVITQGGGQHGVTIASGQVKVVYSTGDSESPSGVYDAFDSLAVTLAANAVGTANITDANVTLAKMAINSINASKIVAASITDTELAANAVVTAGITDANVTTAKIATNAINASKIINASITSTEMAPNAVEAVNIAANAVTTVKITDVNVTTAKIADDAVTAAKLATNAVVTASIVAGSVTAAEIANNAITSNEIGALANLTVTGDVTIDSSTSPAQSTLKVDSSNNRVGIGVDSPDVSLDIGSMTDSIHVPVGTTAQRPGSPAAGYFRYNTTDEQFEGYTTEWGAIGGGGGTNTFTTDTFTSATSPGVDGSTTAFHLSQTVSDENDIIVFIDGVFQNKDAYTIATASGETTLTFDTAPASGRTITVYTVATAVSGSNLGISTMTGDGSDTTLTLTADPVHENNVQVYFDGVYQSKSNFTVSGTTLTFSTAPPSGVLVEAMTLTQTDINTATKLLDADKDTMIQVEESSDEDIIRFDTAGTERMTIAADGTISFADNDITNVGNIYVDQILSDVSPAVITIGAGSGDTLHIKGMLNTNLEFADSVKALFGGANDFAIYHDGSNNIIEALKSDSDIIFKGNDGGSPGDTTALTLDMSAAGAAAFNSYITSTAVYGKDDGNTGIQFDGSDVITLHTGGTERMHFDSGGHIGIKTSTRADGSTAMAFPLTVNSANDGGNILEATRTSNGSFQMYMSTAGISYLDATGSGPELRFRIGGSDIQEVSENGTITFRSGTTSPTNTIKLQHHGTYSSFGPATSDGNDNHGIGIEGGGAGAGSNSRGAGIWLYGNEAAHPGHAIIQLGAAGDFELYAGSGADLALNVNTNGTVSVGRTETAGTTDYGIDLYSSGHLYLFNSSSGDNDAFRMYDSSGTQRAAIDADGDYHDLSDERYKENIVDAPSVLDTISKMKVRSFNWKENGRKKTYGFIAQELNEVAAETVRSAKDDEDIWGVKHARIVPMLTKAIQEQQTLIETLEAKVKALEEK